MSKFKKDEIVNCVMDTKTGIRERGMVIKVKPQEPPKRSTYDVKIIETGICTNLGESRLFKIPDDSEPPEPKPSKVDPKKWSAVATGTKVSAFPKRVRRSLGSPQTHRKG